MIKMVKGDLLKADTTIIAHGCNCSGGFGSGVAGAIAQRFPVAQKAYFKKHKTGRMMLGQTQAVPITGHENIKIVLNCITQEEFGYDGKQYVSYDAIKACMNQLYAITSAMDATIAIPKIGCGLGGGKWSEVKKIIEEVFHDRDIKVYYL